MNVEYYAEGFITNLHEDIVKMKVTLKDGKQITIIENSTGVNIDWGE